MKNRVLVLHSGVSGFACDCAQGVAERLPSRYHDVVVADLSRFLASHILSERALLVCLERSPRPPSEEVLDFVDFLSSLEVNSLCGLKYSVLSIGDTARRHWADLGRQIDGLLAMLGADRLSQRAECAPSALSMQHWMDLICARLSLHRPPIF